MGVQSIQTNLSTHLYHVQRWFDVTIFACKWFGNQTIRRSTEFVIFKTSWPQHLELCCGQVESWSVKLNLSNSVCYSNAVDQNSQTFLPFLIFDAMLQWVYGICFVYESFGPETLILATRIADLSIKSSRVHRQRDKHTWKSKFWT